MALVASNHRIATIVAIWAAAVVPVEVSAQPAATDDLSNSVLARFPIHTDGCLVLLPVKFGGSTYNFAFDTGSSINVYGKSLASKLGPAVRRGNAITPHGRIEVEFFAAPAAFIGSLSLKTTEPVACVNLDAVTETEGEEVHGVIGMAFLKDHVVEIDIDAGRLSFLRKDGPYAGDAVRLQSREYPFLPRAEIEIEGIEKTLFVIDTGQCGFASGDLKGNDFTELVRRNLMKPIGRVRSGPLSGMHFYRIGELREARILEYRVRRTVFAEADNPVIGLNFLRRFNVVFDFPNDVMYLRPSKYYERGDDVDLSGLAVARRNNGFVVTEVHDGKPASGAGIKVGDVIVSIDGEEVRSLRLRTLQVRFCEEGAVRISIRRGQRIVSAKLELRAASGQ